MSRQEVEYERAAVAERSAEGARLRALADEVTAVAEAQRVELTSAADGLRMVRPAETSCIPWLHIEDCHMPNSRPCASAGANNSVSYMTCSLHDARRTCPTVLVDGFSCVSMAVTTEQMVLACAGVS